MEEKKTESEQNEDESQQNKKWIESLGFNNLPVEERRTDEEWKRMVENLQEIAHGNVSEAPPLGFSSRKHVFSPKTAEMHNIGVRDPLEQPPSTYL